MILGQDFDCETNYKKSLGPGSESITKDPTWRNLVAFLDELNAFPNICFFTNAILSVRKGNKGTGKSPAFKDKDFIKQCQEFFLYQLEIQKPLTIFALGKYVGEFLSSTSEDLERNNSQIAVEILCLFHDLNFKV